MNKTVQYLTIENVINKENKNGGNSVTKKEFEQELKR